MSNVIVSRQNEGYFCGMNTVLQINYKALILGGILTIGFVILLLKNGVTYFIIDPNSVSTVVYTFINILGFIFSWLLIAYFISKFSVWKVLGVFGFLIISMFAEQYLHVSNNPITIPLLMVFWVGVFYLVLPEFFKQYKLAIFIVYGLIISYYFFDFVSTSNYTTDNRRDFIKFWLIPVPVFTALWAYEQWRWFTQLKADKAKAELALLKSQINPHFFFNTLNNLYGLVIEKSDRAPEVILKLSDMMRYTIYNGKEDLVALKDEISYLKNYIELHKIRYQKKVDILFTHDVENELKVAPLLFIILLENAFKHGVEKMHGQSFINLQMQSQGTQLSFTIENNFDELTPNHKPGIGLDNLKKRLDHLYPGRHELMIEEKASTYKVQLKLELI